MLIHAAIAFGIPERGRFPIIVARWESAGSHRLIRSFLDTERSWCLLNLGFLGPLLDHVDRVFAVALVLVALSRRGDVLAVRSQEPPAMLPSVILVGLELQLGRGILLDPL